MRVIVASCCCSRQYNENLFAMRNKSLIIPSQKFMDMLLRGLTAQENIEVDNLCLRAVSSKTCKVLKWKYEEETSEDGKIRYEYLPFVNGKYLRFLSTMYSEYKYCKRRIKEAKKKGEQIVLLTDVTIWNAAIPAQKAAKVCRIPTVALITDLPQYTNVKKGTGKKRSVFSRCLNCILQKSLHSYDAYILLTEAMKDVVIQRQQPYVLTECFVDADDVSINEQTPQDKFIFLYAGGVYEKYGVKAFTQAFEQVADEKMEFWVFGDGDFAMELDNNPTLYPHTAYKGCVSPLEIIKYERQANVLVNPRPTEDEYTKYSFPSKTAEYMTTGVPVLTTPLPGIPDEYRPYALWFDGSSITDYRNGILRARKMPREELIRIGKSAQNFCVEKKTKEAQGAKIAKLLQEIVNKS